MTWRSTTITGEGRENRRRIEVLVALLIGLAVVGWALSEFGRQQTVTGPDGSMFVTDRNGTAALAELMERRGASVIPYTTRFSNLDPGGSVLIVDPQLNAEYTAEELDALDGFARDGGRVVVAGIPNPDLIGTLLPDDIGFGYRGPAEAEVLVPLSGVGGVVETDGVRNVDTVEPFFALAGEPPVAVAFDRGKGAVVFLSDSSILWNQRIDANGPWLVGLLGDGNVRFDEVRHGFESAPAAESPTGLLAALPERVRTVVYLLVPVVLLALVVYGRRFGPPEARERSLAPARRELVDALAGLLARTDDPVAAAQPVSHRVRTLAARRAGLPHDTPVDRLVGAAREIGLDPDQLAVALEPADENGILTAQRVLAHLTQKELQ